MLKTKGILIYMLGYNLVLNCVLGAIYPVQKIKTNFCGVGLKTSQIPYYNPSLKIHIFKKLPHLLRVHL